MARQQGWFALILALSIAAGAVCISFPLQLGLDLSGGSQLTLEVQSTEQIPSISSEEVEAVKAVLDRRVNSLGVSESILQTIGSDQLLLELPGEQDPSRAARVLGKTALLEFRVQKQGTNDLMQKLKIARIQIENLNQSISANNSYQLNQLEEEQVKKIIQLLELNSLSGTQIEQIEKLKPIINTKIATLFETSSLTGKDLVSAGRRQEQNLSSWEVTLNFTQQGGDKFSQLTKSIAGSSRLLGIILDGQSISEATVGNQFSAAGITGGAASISGGFTAEEARELEVQLRGGSLPLPLKVLQVKTIGATLGEENIKRSLIAAFSGLILVTIFMIFNYRLAGIVAVISLSLYSLFNITIYSLLPVTLTLPGIAGFILSIGMAVDANVLIFERFKDELKSGNTLIRSIDAGFSLALSSIIDGHITTLISCSALFYLGTGFVKGFAATLGIGVLISLFTALTCTKLILKFLMNYKSLRKSENFISSNQLLTSSS
tara:strand:- start:5856 stop:7328 length:1473 start_codon:yes stop_codon:yes gene_type:complete